MSIGWKIRMKYKLILAACTALLPSMVSAQNPPVKDCRSLEAAGNFLEADEVLANGLACKVVKAKPGALATPQASKKDSDTRAKLALLGIIEPEEVNLQEPHAKPNSGPAVIAPQASVKSALGEAAVPDSSAAPQNAALEEGHVPSVAEAARAYQKTSRRQTAKDPEYQLVAKPPAIPEVKSHARSASAAPSLPAVAAQSSIIPARISADKPAVAMEPKAEALPVASVSAAPAAKTIANEAQPALEITLVTVPTASASAAPATERAQSTGKMQAMGTEPWPAVKPGLSPEPAGPPTAATEVSQPEMKTGSFDPRDKPGSVDKPEVRPAIPESESDSTSERPQEVRLGVFEKPKESDAETKTQMPVDPFGAPPEDLAIHEPRPGCTRIVSLGSMERDRLVLATPDWAMKWLEKNQKRFPGVCFADSPLVGIPNYLIVFFTVAPPSSQAGLAANALVSASAPSESSGGTYTTSYGSTWHYTYDNAATTTVTTALTENVPHNQPAQTLYATAYTEQGIPISQHWPGPAKGREPAKGHEKETKDSRGRKHDVVPAAVLIMSDLLGEIMADLAAH
jgi:hypothetical protein